MKDPDYGTISDINPDGGGDYTTLQAWYEDTCTRSEIQHARCHHSDLTDLGQLDTTTRTCTYEPTAEQPVCIYAADGSEADGSRGESLQGAAVLAEGAYAACLVVTWKAAKIQGLRLTLLGDGSAGIASVGGQSVLIERCTIIIDGPAWGQGIIAEPLNYGTAAIRNNLMLNTNSAAAIVAIAVATGEFVPAVSAAVDDNSVVNCNFLYAGSVMAAAASPSHVVNMTARNNVVVDDGVQGGDCFRAEGPGTVNWAGSSHNVSSDATADSVVGGSDNIINAAIGDVWADIADADAPLKPKTGGLLDPANGANLYAAGVTTDGLGRERPSQGAHYRGGQEIFCGLYKAYGGPAPSAVDYGAPLASVRAGTASMDIAGLGLAGGGSHWLAVRVTSAAGVEETNTDRLARVVVDEGGQLQPPPLAAVEDLTAELQADGSVIVGFAHATWPGWAAPTKFEVLTDNGTGELDLETPAAIIDVTDAGAGDYEVVVAGSTLPAKFSARACSGDGSGPVAPAITVSLPAGPAAVEEM